MKYKFHKKNFNDKWQCSGDKDEDDDDDDNDDEVIKTWLGKS